MSDYSRKIAQAVVAEMTRLGNGSAEQLKRRDKFLEYIDRIMGNPENTDYIKQDCGHYRAAPYKTGQYRIFFELVGETIDFDSTKDTGIKAAGKFVHFVWMNNENYKHNSDKHEFDPCYREFKNLMQNNRLEIFKRPLAPKGFNIGGTIGKSPVLYPKFYDLYGVAQASANLSLETAQSGLTEYKLDGLISIPDAEQREFELLKHIVSQMNSQSFKIIWEIMKDDRFLRHQNIAQKLKMHLIDDDSLWAVYSN